jgi:hypothetical protein
LALVRLNRVFGVQTRKRELVWLVELQALSKTRNIAQVLIAFELGQAPDMPFVGES